MRAAPWAAWTSAVFSQALPLRVRPDRCRPALSLLSGATPAHADASGIGSQDREKSSSEDA